MGVGQRLKRLRTAKGLTQTELAKPKYSHAYVSAIEAGRRPPTRQAIEHFAAKLDIDPDELASGRPPDLGLRLGVDLHEARIAISAGQIDDAQTTCQKVAARAERHGLHELRAKAYEGLALCEERRGHLEEAIDHYDRAIEIHRRGSLLSRVDAVVGKARCAKMQGDNRYGIYLLESLLDNLDAEGLREPGAMLRIHATLVRHYFDAGLFMKANESAEQALLLAPRVTDPIRIAQMHINVLSVLIHQGDFTAAEASLDRAEELYRLANLQTEIGRALHSRGYTLIREDRLEEARPQLESAREIFEQTQSSLDEARTLNELARVERLSGRVENAKTNISKAMSLLADNDVAEFALAHYELAFCSLESDSSEAEKHLRVAIDLFERAEDPVKLAASYRILGDLLRSEGNDHDGCEAYRTGLLELEERL
jgi:tetratricopeptide (TPR) repeat protein